MTRSKPLLHLFLFAATCVTTSSCFHFFFGRSWADAAWFSGAALLILGAHEMGHYVMARKHGVETTLPFFIPVPFGFGTLGAVIRVRSRIPSKNALVDIGAAGPLAGLFFAVPLLVVGVLLSTPVPAGVAEHFTFPSEMSLFSVVRGGIRWLSSGNAPDVKDGLEFGDNLLLLLVQRAVNGAGMNLAQPHPVLIAAWFGLLVTMLNLMPIGQLDGGHLTHAWFGRHAIGLGKVLAGAMAFLAMFYSVGWVVWLVLTARVIGFQHPAVSDALAPLSTGRKLICALCFVFFALTLMPIPVSAG